VSADKGRPEGSPGDGQTLVSVAVPVVLDRGFSYAVPPSLRGTVPPGTRVVVPFGQRVLVGVVRPVSGALDDPAAASKIRDLLEVFDPPGRPALGPELVALCEWIADYYCAPIGEVYRLALPGAAMGNDVRRAAITARGRAALEGSDQAELEAHDLRLLAALAEGGKAGAVAGLTKLEPPIPAVLKRLCKLVERELVEVDAAGGKGKRARTEAHYRRTDRLRGSGADEEAIKRALGRSKQRRGLLDYLDLQFARTAGAGDPEAGAGWVPISELRGPFPRARVLLPPLLEAGLVVTSERLRGLDPFAGLAEVPSAPITALTDDQGEALAGLSAALEAGRYSASLLHGITGSGKTEVYLRLIAAAREGGGGAIVLVPEIALTPQLAQRFRQRFGDQVTVLHSGLSAQQRRDAWEHIRSGRRPIVIGARSAVFAPVPELRVIVVDEEHDGSFKQEEGVRYNARDVALVRARSSRAVVVLGSATPSLESWKNVQDGRLDLWSLTTRPTPRPLPSVEVVNLREHMPDPETLLSARLRQRVVETVAAGEQVILFLNRRGYTTALSCKTCGSFQQCPDCSAPSMTYHLGRNRLMCHLCGHIEAASSSCLACGGTELEHGAAGTERVEVAIGAALEGIRVLRLDRDTSRGRALLETLSAFRRHEADVLIGTQMLSKGHDFPGVTLVGVLRADHGLGLPDFRATERVFQLLTQVAGRAGRGERPGRVLIQTWAPDHPAIEYARTHDFAGFAAYELEARGKANNPPWTRLALIRITGLQRGRVEARAAELGGFARDLARRVNAAETDLQAEPPIMVLGPVDSPIERVNRKHRMQILIRARTRPPLRWLLKHLRLRLGQTGRGPAQTQARVDVDPYGML